MELTTAMRDLDMDAADPVDLVQAPLDVIILVLESAPLTDRFTCALVCKAWAKAATAATRSIILMHKEMQGVSCLQRWLDKHGNSLKVLQLHECRAASLTALPCPQLQVLVLHEISPNSREMISLDSRVWGDIAAATKLTSVSLRGVVTTCHITDIMAALTALPNLQKLTWGSIVAREQIRLMSLNLQQVPNLMALELHAYSAEDLEQLGTLTKLQHLSINAPHGWDSPGYPGLQELKALTSLDLLDSLVPDVPDSVSHLTALQQFITPQASDTGLGSLQALTGLTQLKVWLLWLPPTEVPPLQLPSLHHLVLHGLSPSSMPMSFLASCTQLRVLEVRGLQLRGPGSLVASTILQHLVLSGGGIRSADAADHPVPWQLVFPGPGRLPHLTSLQLRHMEPDLKQSDIDGMVACCSSLQELHLNVSMDGCAFSLARLPDLTRLHLCGVTDEACGALAQLTGLRELVVGYPAVVPTAGLRQLAALRQLTSVSFPWVCQDSKVSYALPSIPMLNAQHPNAVINLEFDNKAPAGHPSDVSAQLLQFCNLTDAVAGVRAGAGSSATLALEEVQIGGHALL